MKKALMICLRFSYDSYQLRLIYCLYCKTLFLGTLYKAHNTLRTQCFYDDVMSIQSKAVCKVYEVMRRRNPLDKKLDFSQTFGLGVPAFREDGMGCMAII